jgi:hypothetical protein
MSTSSRDAMARNDSRAWLDTMGPDESERMDVVTPVGEAHGTYARIGLVVLCVSDDGDVDAHGHTDEATARACYQARVEEAQRMVAVLAEAGALVTSEDLTMAPGLSSVPAYVPLHRAPDDGPGFMVI